MDAILQNRPGLGSFSGSCWTCRTPDLWNKWLQEEGSASTLWGICKCLSLALVHLNYVGALQGLKRNASSWIAWFWCFFLQNPSALWVLSRLTWARFSGNLMAAALNNCWELCNARSAWPEAVVLGGPCPSFIRRVAPLPFPASTTAGSNR